MPTKQQATIIATVIVAALVYVISSFEKALPTQGSPVIAIIAAVVLSGVVSGFITRDPLYGGVAAAVGGAVGQVAAVVAGAQLATLVPQLTPVLFHIAIVPAMFLAGMLLSIVFRMLPVEEMSEATEMAEDEEKTELGEEKEEMAFKICKFCNEKIPADAVFCPFCGHKLVEESIKSE